MPDRSVRLARAADAPAIADVQLRTWRAAYATVLPADVLSRLHAADVGERWRAATVDPPSPRHRVLVALDGPEVVGFAAIGPADDADSEPMLDAELHTLLVDPGYGRHGHGSRLLAAVVDRLRGDGFRRAQTWVLATDDVLRGFLASAGWSADGATRELEMGRPVRQVRLHTDLGEAE